MDWRANLRIYLAMTGWLVIIAIGAWRCGATPIIIFVALDAAALGYALFQCQVDGQHQEVVSVTRESITVERGRFMPVEFWQARTPWLQVILEHSWDSDHLKLRSHGRETEIGIFLNDADRLKLAGDLDSVLAPYSGFNRTPRLS